MKNNKQIFILAQSLLLIGCGGGSTASNGPINSDGSAKDPFKIEKVSYVLNGSQPPLCHQPASITVSRAQKENDRGVANCLWMCGEYEGAKPISVSLYFVQYGNDGIWEFESDVVTTASSECHD